MSRTFPSSLKTIHNQPALIGGFFDNNIGVSMTDHAQQINDAIEADQPLPYTENLTASRWSHCSRAMWLQLRNATFSPFKAETLRTFKMGHVLEDCIVDWLKQAGYKISHQQAEVKNQWGKPLGHIDGIIFADRKYRLLEIKTSNSKYFKQWTKDGAPEKYRAQASLYMAHSDQLSASKRKLDEVMFVVLNKDTSEIYIDIVPYDEQWSKLQTDRMESVIESEALPDGDESFKCNFCSQKSTCKGESIAITNCRTCAHVSIDKGSFVCNYGYGKICENFVYHPQLIELLGYTFESVDNETQAIIFDKFAMAAPGVVVKGKPTFTNDEFIMAHPAGLVNDNFILGMKEMLGSTIELVEKSV